MKKKLTLFILSMGLFVSCGKSKNVNPINNNVNNLPGTTGIDLGASLNTKLSRIERALPCLGGVARYTVDFAVQTTGNQTNFIARRSFNVNSTNDRGVYVGKTDQNDIVVVKELDNSIKEIRVRVCDVDRLGTRTQQISGAQFYSGFAVSNVTSCSVNQISELIMELTYNNGVISSIPLIVTPINIETPINTVCPTDFLSDPVGQGF